MKIQPKIRKRCWSNTDLADKIRGTEKPRVATWEGRKKWREEARKAHPIRYWIAESFLKIAQDYFMGPVDIWNSIRYYVKNRWVSQSHALVADPKHISRGTWCDLSERILYCNFDALVEFVEIECAAMYNIDKERKLQRSISDGLDYLKWQSKVTGGMSEEAPIILDLYLWWTVKRDQRLDPYEIEVADGDYSEVWALLNQYHAEDTEKLKKLMEVRSALWT